MNREYVKNKIKRIKDILDNELNCFDSGMSDDSELLEELQFYNQVLDNINNQLQHIKIKGAN
jgi:hypothetical protein